MTLPPLALPTIPLPFEIPLMVHPVLVHFAIALPVVVLLLELINLFAKKRTIGVLSFLLMVLIAVVFFAAYLSGAADGKEAKAFLSAEAKEALTGHKQLGVYLVYASGLLMLFKLFSVMIRKTAIKVLFFLVLIVFTVSVFNEGKKGGALVYQYGVNVKSVPAIGNTPKVEKAAKVVEPKAENKEKNSTVSETVVPETVVEKKEASPQEVTPVVSPKTEAPKAEVVEATPTPVEVPKPEGNVTH